MLADVIGAGGSKEPRRLPVHNYMQSLAILGIRTTVSDCATFFFLIGRPQGAATNGGAWA
jgi:hypothetical protein